MTMRMSVKQLRRLILREMKLGIAGAEGDHRAWGKKDLPDDPKAYEPEEGGPTYIATDVLDFDPGEDVKALYRGKHHTDMAGDPIGSEEQDRPTRPAALPPKNYKTFR